MKRIALLSLLLLCASFSFAKDNAFVRGILVDAGTGNPVEFVTVSVKDAGDAFAGGGVSDEKGAFEVGPLKAGQYKVTFTLLGYKELEKAVKVSDGGLNMGKVQLEEDSKMIEDVLVTGQASTMKFDIDRKVFSVGNDIASKGISVSELLENIPSIEVDQDGSISLRGNSSVTIWINGKPSGLTSDNQGDILEQLPAETIERIEVITNPGAKYSAEGTAGIINIIMKEEARHGYYGSVQAGANAFTDPFKLAGYNVNGNINFNAGNWSGYGGLGYRHRSRVGGSITDRSFDDDTYLNQESDETGDGDNLFLRGGLAYKLTPKDEIGVGGFGMFGSNGRTTATSYLSNVPSYYTNSLRTSQNDDSMLGYNAELTYQHKWAENHTLDLLAEYNSWGSDGTTVYSQEKNYEDGRTEQTYQSQESVISPYHVTLQADYVNKFNKDCKVEAGYKGELSYEDSPVETKSGTSAADAAIDRDLWNDFIYNQQVHALYGTWSQNIDNFGYQIGLRGEYTDMETQSLGYGQTAADVPVYSNHYFKLFPTVFLTYRLSESDEMQFNYTRRIRRPFGGQLNSFLNITDSTNISYGNPYLMPQYANSFEVNYIKSWDDMRQTLSVSLYYRGAQDMIQRISYLDGVVMKSTFANVGTDASAGTELVGKNKIGKWLDLTSTVNLYYYKLNDYDYVPEGTDIHITDGSQGQFNWNARLIANAMLPKDWSLQVRGDYRAKTIIAQGYRLPTYRMDVGVRKSFGPWAVNLNVRDALNSFKFRNHTSGTGYTQDAQFWHGGRRAMLTLSYSFGNMKPQPKKGEHGDDSEGSSGYDSYSGGSEE